MSVLEWKALRLSGIKMNQFFRIRRTTLVCSLLATTILILSRCISSDKPASEELKVNDFSKFAGSQVCSRCHRDLYKQHLQTEHHLTSVVATEESILGSFEKGSNSFAFDKANEIIMERRKNGFHQVYYNYATETRAGKFDIVIGSGRKGQSYLSWVDSHLVQLPITYFTPSQQWSNSPGYPPNKVVFNRPITSRCLECHSTYFHSTSTSAKGIESFETNKIIYGIECEKCHGPGADHVKFQMANPESKTAKFIVNPATLPRERILDFCSLCHGGRLSKTKPSFSFKIGDTLANHFNVSNAYMDASNIDVHGNQSGLLSLSRCFQLTNMTCMTCHNPHQKETDIQVFSQRCISCHSDNHQPKCKMEKQLGKIITNNCIDCHMPKQPSHAVAVYQQGAQSPTPALMRTHYIKIYSEESKHFLEGKHNQQDSLRIQDQQKRKRKTRL